MTPRPFTVIGGFLGAGKTTLVNRILRRASGTRYAVLVNDFGAVNVDAGLIAAHDGRTMALTNGCICCSLSDGFIETMLRLMAEPEAFDHVIVEASGVAEPGRIMDFARLDPLLAPDAILTLADAETLLERLADARIGDIVARQIGQADLLLLNKTDLAGGQARAAAAAERLRALNPRAPVLSCRDADLPLGVLLGTGLSAGPAGASAEDGHHHHPPFHTALVRHDRPVERGVFMAWEDALPTDILRGKGRVALAGEGPFLWQRVGARSELTPAPRADQGTEIVLIGAAPIAPPVLGGGEE
ncbi:MAG TPA: GTP-binding protein [Paracoccaceae bacterium]|nr:GTP-binding protein [Paracoccaceae bacterium]